MKLSFNKVIMFLIVFVMLGACVKTSSPVSSKLFSANARTKGNKDVDIVVTEIERKEKTSLVEVKFNSGASVASSVFMVCSFYNLAKIRGFRYTVEIENFGKDERYLIGFIPSRTKEEIMQLGTEFAKYDVSQITDNKIYEPIC